MTALAGQVVAVTGAGSGIGRALALGLAARGAVSALSDRDADGLDATARLVREAHPRVLLRTDQVDVSSRSAVEAWAAAVVEQFGRADVVVNNAGVAFTGDVAASQLEDLDAVMSVNFWGVVHGTTAFLPHLLAADRGHVVNISSLFGLLAVPSQSAYVAAKFAVRGWTEALRQELLVAGSGVQVTCVHPGGIRTSIARNGRAAPGLDKVALAANFDARMARMEPDRAAQIILRGVERNRPRVLVGADAVALDLLQRVLGSGYQRLVAGAVRRSRPHERAGAEPVRPV